MKIKPYVFLFILLVILAFIIGVRYGQKVEQLNKTIPTVSPSQPTATPTASLEFKNYQNSLCGIEFLYPNSLTIKSESSASALLVADSSQIQIDCNLGNELSKIFEDKSVATAELTFQNKKIQAKTTNQGSIYIFKILNSFNGRMIFIAIQKNLFPLFDSTFHFNSR